VQAVDPSGAYDPALHWPHALALVAPARLDARPAGHSEHELALAADHFPGWHCKQSKLYPFPAREKSL
jgi:hypothetical protein